ncbi:MAG: malic enzyme-like NAD(P)-binding protein, partial [Cyanobium sp.]
MKRCCYHDDIQGTAGVINALKFTGGQLKDQRQLFLGAGSAAIGLANLMVSALGQQGIAAEVARQQIRMVDTQGVVVTGRPGLPDHKKPYAKDLPPSQPFDHTSLASECPRIVEAIDNFKPTILIGVSTVGNLFNQALVEAMARHNAQPIIFPLSNPTEKMECLATNAKVVTDEMFIEAAHAVADQVTAEQLKLGMLFPPQSEVLEVA